MEWLERVRENVGYALRPKTAQQEAQRLYRRVLDEVKKTPPQLKGQERRFVSLVEIAQFGDGGKVRHVLAQRDIPIRTSGEETLGIARVSYDRKPYAETMSLHKDGEKVIILRHRRGVARILGDHAVNTAYAFAGVQRALAIMKEDGPVKYINPKTF